MADIIAVFAKNLRMLRERAGFSQEELAYRAGLHRTYIGSVERGHRNVSLRTIERIAKALDVAPVQLISDQLDNDGIE